MNVESDSYRRLKRIRNQRDVFQNAIKPVSRTFTLTRDAVSVVTRVEQKITMTSKSSGETVKTRSLDHDSIIFSSL